MQTYKVFTTSRITEVHLVEAENANEAEEKYWEDNYETGDSVEIDSDTTVEEIHEEDGTLVTNYEKQLNYKIQI